MTSRWVEIGRIQREAGHFACENTDAEGNHSPRCNGRHEEGHHGLFEGQRAEKNKAYRMFLDHPINYTASSHICNFERVGDPEKARDARFAHHLTVYPAWQIRQWLKSAPDEIKARHEWKRYWKAVQ